MLCEQIVNADQILTDYKTLQGINAIKKDSLYSRTFRGKGKNFWKNLWRSIFALDAEISES
jgi:hypothetical protein